jgi:hypothetical protein
MWVAGFTHGSAHRNPFTTDNLFRVLVAEYNVKIFLRAKSIRLVYRFLYDISLCIHQDMVPQTLSIPLDTQWRM